MNSLIPVFAAILMSAVPSFAEGSDVERNAPSCVLEVNGKRFIDGPCPIVLGRDGNLTVGSNGSKSLPFWTMILLDPSEKDKAEGFWNESPGSSHAQSRLGDLYKKGDCWVNNNARVCVGGLSDQPMDARVSQYQRPPQSNQTVAQITTQSLSCTDPTVQAVVLRLSGEGSGFVKAISGNFSLNAIRLREKNSESGMLLCAASLKIKYQWAGNQMENSSEITYTVENSSDGPYVTVYNPQGNSTYKTPRADPGPSVPPIDVPTSVGGQGRR